MKIIKESSGLEGTEFYPLELDNEPVMIHFGKQIDDLLISSPEGDVLISWDLADWDDSQSMLIKTFDNLKEITNLRCTTLLVKKYLTDGKKIKVWITAQRN